MKFRIVLLLLLPFLVQCTSQKETTRSAAEALQLDKEQVWQLVWQNGKEVPQSDDPIILMFHPESGTLRGRVACNRYFADYRLRLVDVTESGSRYSLTISDVSGGDVQCPEGDMAAQDRYLSFLGKTTTCLLTPYALTLYQKGRETLKFELQ